LAKNTIRAGGAEHLSAAIKGHKTLTVLDISSNEIGAYSKDNDGDAPWIASPEGPVAVADAIRDMGALSKLDLRENFINEKGHALLQQAAGSRYASYFFDHITFLTRTSPP
jgi:hypothetical protein